MLESRILGCRTWAEPMLNRSDMPSCAVHIVRSVYLIKHQGERIIIGCKQVASM